ncbi:MAG: hypothetical protein H6Q58_1703 [Firmicutes bacterium]|nr:hypothetical protein [Bacillota bacterium]
MRKKSLIFMLVVVSVILIGGCSVTVQRDSLKVDKALIGHWVNTEGALDYYFSDTSLIKVEKGGTTTNMTYTIVKTNDNDNTITIQVKNPAGTVLEEDKKEIKFSADKKTMTETVTVLGVKISEVNFSYVDSKTKP